MPCRLLDREAEVPQRVIRALLQAWHAGSMECGAGSSRNWLREGAVVTSRVITRWMRCALRRMGKWRGLRGRRQSGRSCGGGWREGDARAANDFLLAIVRVFMDVVA
jgi:hypothetical protein